MAGRSAGALLACAFFIAMVTTAANANDCKLQRIASLDFTENGAVLIPVSVEGTNVQMAIDTGSSLSAIDPVVAGNLHIIERRIMQGMVFDSKGEPITYIATPHSLRIGDMHADDLKIFVWPSPLTENGRIGGLIAADMLRHYDVDIDFGNHKLNLFSQDHCQGKVVYWTNTNVAVVPMHVVNSGHIIVPVSLDGRQLDAVLDTGSTFSYLSAERAHGDFGLAAGSSDVKKVGETTGVVATEVYEHTFKALGLEGLAIGNPTLRLRDNLTKYSMTRAAPTGTRLSDADESGGNTDLILGLNELRHLHLYIAYKEQNLYVSPAEVPALAAATPPASAAPATAATTH